MDKVCLDANVLLDVLLNRARRARVIEVLSALDSVQFCISALTVDLVMYFVESQNQSKALAWQFLNAYEIIDITKVDVLWARDNDAGDFEDALQIACARRVGSERFVTLDQKLEGMYGQFISVMTIR